MNAPLHMGLYRRVAKVARLGAALMIGFAGLARAQDAGPEPRPDYIVARGQYIATAAGCASCHTNDGGPAFAGGLAIQTPFGPLRAPNITPDPETGIGAWTEAEFTRALREGIRADGQPLYPAMPYNHYTKIEDADIAALWAYVHALPPVVNAVKVDELLFPYDIRQSMIAWQALFFEPGRFQPDPAAGAEVNRGAYLVQALGHCSACHTPRNPLGAEEADRYLTGAVVAPWYAPNISNDAASVLRDYTADSLADYLSDANDGHNRAPVGPMAEMVGNSLSKLTPEDVRAIAVYLKTRAAPAAAPADAPATLTDAALRAGADVYAGNCVSCHGQNGEGVDGAAARLAGSGSVADGPPDNSVAVLLAGVAPRADWGVMPSFAAALTDEQIADVVNYVRSSWGNAASIAANAAQVAASRAMIGAPETEVVQATTCPAVPDDRLDDATRAALAGLGTGAPTAAALTPIVSAYDALHAGLSRSDRVVALTGAYCATVADQLPSREAVLRRQLAFMNIVGQLTR